MKYKKTLNSHLWLAVAVFGTVDAFLSYVPLPSIWRVLLFFCFFIPAFLAALPRLASRGTTDKRDPSKTELIPSSPWLLAVFLGVVFFTRFFKLTSLHPWPSSDEALQGYFAVDLLRQWNWRFFYTSGQHPPLLIWLLKWFFQWSNSPFLNLWFLPALLSVLFLFFAYLAARMFFSRSVARLFTCLLATGFWPLSFGRFCVQGTLVPVFEMAAFFLLGWFLNSKGTKAKCFLVLGLGLVVGIGSWTYTSWLVVILFFLCIGTWGLLKQTGDSKYVFLSLMAFFLGAFPWFRAFFEEKFGGYMVGVSFLSGFFRFKDQVETSLSYLTNLFWGTWKQPVSYGPTWGGMLNPFVCGLFFWGLVELYRNRATTLARFLGLAAVLFLLPGFLSADHVEMFRIIQLMPLLLLVAALGFESALKQVPIPRRNIVFVVFLSLCLVFDFFRVLQPSLAANSFSSPRVQITEKDENYWAYQRLAPIAAQMGPGLVFTDFILLTHNHTLHVASFPFNALVNPSLDPSKSRWAAVVTNVHYVPFLLKRFPGSQWQLVTPDAVEDGGSAVVVFPINSRNRPVFMSWIPVHAYFHRLGIEAENMMNNPVEYQQALAQLPTGYFRLNGDPFLESCYAEWLAQYHQGSDFNWNIQALQRGLQRGYPTANLYYKLGGFYFWNHEEKKSKQAYLMAIKCKPNYTSAQEILSRIWGKGPSPGPI